MPAHDQNLTQQDQLPHHHHPMSPDQSFTMMLAIFAWSALTVGIGSFLTEVFGPASAVAHILHVFAL